MSHLLREVRMSLLLALGRLRDATVDLTTLRDYAATGEGNLAASVLPLVQEALGKCREAMTAVDEYEKEVSK